MANKQTRTRTPRPIPAMLPGAFGTKLENQFAEINNELALQGHTTADPIYQMLQKVQRILVSEGVCTFERAVGGVPAAETETQAAPAPTKRRKRTSRKTKAPTPPPAATGVDLGLSRVIEESEIAALQVEGSVDDDAPYGRDSEGLALAPYGVKLSGLPMKRRGRKAAAPVETASTEAEASANDSEEVDDEDDEDDLTEEELDALLEDA